jgi:hypothetical protein
MKHVLLCVIAVAVGCDASSVTPRGTWQASDKTDQPATCKEACGQRAAAGCWCDDACPSFGDCCPDRAAVCAAPSPPLTWHTSLPVPPFVLQAQLSMLVIDRVNPSAATRTFPLDCLVSAASGDEVRVKCSFSDEAVVNADGYFSLDGHEDLGDLQSSLYASGRLLPGRRLRLDYLDEHDRDATGRDRYNSYGTTSVEAGLYPK